MALISPIARRLAKEKQVDISLIKGSGHDGKILESDVLKFIAEQQNAPKAAEPAPAPAATSAAPAAAPAAAAAPVSPSKEVAKLEARREKVTTIRKAIARAMKNSQDNVAYVSLVHEIDMTKLWDLRKSVVEKVKDLTGIKLTFLPFILKAIAIAIKDFQIFGAKYDEKTEELVYPDTVNLGVAVDTDHGLMVPVIKNAQSLNLVEFSQEIIRLANLARTKTIKPADMSGATFTITNYGSVGSLFGTPVINYPELAIAGVGAIVDKVYWKNGAAVPGKVMWITIAADHRWIDGATMGKFISKVKSLLEQPEILGVF
ncbi:DIHYDROLIPOAMIDE ACETYLTRANSFERASE COMPONENT OF PYRUVATE DEHYDROGENASE COMPLEX [Mycoplasmopsis pulmonis]|uniref:DIHYDROLIPOAMIDE ACETYLTRANSFERASE COMPONENT OF PYRUVATE DEHYDROGENASE COMPLEX n=1 Tax=Mycoplasmopsis pulmonis (strain UAB CTIP) TaxID=272635 RepID=Q98PG1_MYCPU|nr:2-oxo acid dehydrogenase subunit E2 [Mycoplasmopsis pulmonis]MDZ7293394.1 2-oxo acid dehydrogenase subunit E2 [Mycoplasmopsis pulmonis]CAC13935.1 DIHYDROLIPOAMIDE ACETYLTRANSFERASE COMPONENT OF PYRUVATE DEHYDROGENASE COMPLEX [Mycoplasmopsis pulmonis]VEU68525.1 branched-chain alpha-keto acid dehydrogenase subunit E2 [Mycoplasmopsis pulmonis]